MTQEPQATKNEPWYRDGLSFECLGCGRCCTGAPGYVWVSEEEIAALAGALKISVEEFESQYVREVRTRKSLREFRNGDCAFFDDRSRGCNVYEVRPIQCRTWPFWESNLRSPKTWQETCRACPGCGEGRHYSLAEIEQRLQAIRI